MKKIITFVMFLVIFGILLFPKVDVYEDGGTKTYTAILYKYIKWSKMIDCEECVKPYYKESELILFPNNFKDLDSYWKDEYLEKVPKYNKKEDKNNKLQYQKFPEEVLVEVFGKINFSDFTETTLALKPANTENPQKVPAKKIIVKNIAYKNAESVEKIFIKNGWGNFGEFDYESGEFSWNKGFRNDKIICSLGLKSQDGKTGDLEIICQDLEGKIEKSQNYNISETKIGESIYGLQLEKKEITDNKVFFSLIGDKEVSGKLYGFYDEMYEKEEFYFKSDEKNTIFINFLENTDSEKLFDTAIKNNEVLDKNTKKLLLDGKEISVKLKVKKYNYEGYNFSEKFVNIEVDDLEILE